MIGLLSETKSGNELSFVINSGLFANIEYIFRDSGIWRWKIDYVGKIVHLSFI